MVKCRGKESDSQNVAVVSFLPRFQLSGVSKSWWVVAVGQLGTEGGDGGSENVSAPRVQPIKIQHPVST